AANVRQLELSQNLADSIFVRAAGVLSEAALTFGDVADVGGGGTPRTSVDEYWGGDIPWATPTDVTALAAPYLSGTARRITAARLAACASSVYPAGSILMTSRATIGAFAVAEVATAVNQGFIVVNAKEPVYQWWLFHEMRFRVQDFLSYANGATFLELPRGRFKSLEVRLPAVEMAREFDRTVGPLHARAAVLLKENGRLASTRDELLPLLMSGRVRVRDAEKVVGGVV
ncbi:MAG TPA: restriction endonuclease subunit S, partial [Kofleriaceae bacterium]